MAPCPNNCIWPVRRSIRVATPTPHIFPLLLSTLHLVFLSIPIIHPTRFPPHFHNEFRPLHPLHSYSNPERWSFLAPPTMSLSNFDDGRPQTPIPTPSLPRPTLSAASSLDSTRSSPATATASPNTDPSSTVAPISSVSFCRFGSDAQRGYSVVYRTVTL